MKPPGSRSVDAPARSGDPEVPGLGLRQVRTDEVPWARPGARHTRDLEDVVAYLTLRTDKTTVTRLVRVSWETVARIIVRVVAEAIEDPRLGRLFRIGVDEVSWRNSHRCFTVVADHDWSGAVVGQVWAKSSENLGRFYSELGPERTSHLEAVSLDTGGAFAKATTEMAPGVRQCIDPSHVVALANEALNATRRWEWNEASREHRDA